MIELIKKNLIEAQKTIEIFLVQDQNITAIEQAVLLLAEALKGGNKIISCGNGGSMCDAMHFAEELTGRYRDSRQPLPAIAISDPSHITCVANDFGFEYIFSRAVEAMGKSGDVLIIFTSSGNSQNTLEAANVARKKGMKVIGLTGKDGGKLAALCDIEIRAPKSIYADRVQEIHTKVIHVLLTAIEHSMGLEKISV